jgi:hypothetical protein
MQFLSLPEQEVRADLLRAIEALLHVMTNKDIDEYCMEIINKCCTILETRSGMFEIDDNIFIIYIYD